jgi:hypothetical protein
MPRDGRIENRAVGVSAGQLRGERSRSGRQLGEETRLGLGRVEDSRPKAEKAVAPDPFAAPRGATPPNTQTEP